MWDWIQLLESEHVLKVATLLLPSIALGVGLLQYRKAQCWKRLEWVAKEMDAFFSDSRVDAVLCMIDWGGRNVDLHQRGLAEPRPLTFVDDDMVASALQYHLRRPEGFTEKEAAIRDLFDHFLDRLERMNSFVEGGLLKVEDVRPYLRYWGEHVIDAQPGDGSVDRLVQLRRFIEVYEYTGVQVLFAEVARRRWPADAPGELASRPQFTS